MGSEYAIAVIVVISPTMMRVPIHLYDESSRVAIEVCYEPGDDLLATKMKAAQLIAS